LRPMPHNNAGHSPRLCLPPLSLYQKRTRPPRSHQSVSLLMFSPTPLSHNHLRELEILVHCGALPLPFFFKIPLIGRDLFVSLRCDSFDLSLLIPNDPHFYASHLSVSTFTLLHPFFLSWGCFLLRDLFFPEPKRKVLPRTVLLLRGFQRTAHIARFPNDFLQRVDLRFFFPGDATFPPDFPMVGAAVFLGSSPLGASFFSSFSGLFWRGVSFDAKCFVLFLKTLKGYRGPFLLTKLSNSPLMPSPSCLLGVFFIPFFGFPFGLVILSHNFAARPC